MDEKINRLLKKPVSKWTKADCLHAAKIVSEELPLHKSRPIGIIQRAMLGIPQYNEIIAIAYKLSFDPDINYSKKRPGRPGGTGKSANDAVEFLKSTEKRRARIAKDRVVTIDQITDKEVAYNFGFSKEMEWYRKKYNCTKTRLSEKIRNRIKYMRSKTKSG